jgi:hypothetical protein
MREIDAACTVVSNEQVSGGIWTKLLLFWTLGSVVQGCLGRVEKS